MQKPALLAPSLALFLAACGSIGIGEDLEPVTGAQSDGGTPPMGGGMDASVPSDCELPPPPTAWPFVRSKASYLAEFGNVPGGRASCGLAACHGATSLPFIPAADAQLDDPATLTRAIDSIWEHTLPKTFLGGQPPAAAASPGPVSPVTWYHVPEKGKQPLPYTPAVTTYFENYVKRAFDCGWKPVIAAGPNADPALCDAPTLDLGYCLP